MMQFWTLLASVEGLALPDEVSGTRVVHAQVVRLQYGYFLVLWH